MNNLKRSYRGFLRKFDIIDGILKSDLDQVKAAIEEDPTCVNQLHRPSQMNAAMLAAQGVMLDHLSEILAKAAHLDFSHRDAQGRDLLEVSLWSNDSAIVSAVADAAAEHAPHITNNWPEP